MNTIVINIADAPACWRSNPKYIYIGGLRMDGDVEFDGAPFATPYSVPKDGEALDCFMKYRNRLLLECEGEELCDQIVQRLLGNVLVCDCESRMWCHGNILVSVADGQWHFQGAVHAAV